MVISLAFLPAALPLISNSTNGVFHHFHAVHQVTIRHLLVAAKAAAAIKAALAAPAAAPALQTVPVRIVTAQTAVIATQTTPIQRIKVRRRKRHRKITARRRKNMVNALARPSEEHRDE